MILKELAEAFKNLPDEEVLDYGLGEVFSWRGSYDEVCFSIKENVSVGHCKELIERAYNETFCGYKGGEYSYGDCTPINFEWADTAYTDGEYCQEMIDKITNYKPEDNETRLVRLLVG